tara:strand:- start:354 stop:575 length:222 start_codon:yes stop_codon:yes gene_type:complete
MDEKIKLALKKIHEEIDVSNDDFSSFLFWLVEEKEYSAKSIISVVDSPHKYVIEWELYHKWVYDNYFTTENGD